MKHGLKGLLLGGVLLSLPAWAIQYSYDELHRLTRVQYDNGASIDYGFDPAGNINSIVKIGGNLLPGAPSIDRVSASNGQLRLWFSPPASSGGSTIVDYTTTCTPNNGGAAVSVTSAGSPLTVSGLANHIVYECSLHANNASGSGTESLAVNKKVGPSIIPILTIILN